MLTSISAFPDHLTAQVLLSWTICGENAAFSRTNIFQQKEDENPRHFQIFKKSSQTET